jgi:hypothetical protein
MRLYTSYHGLLVNCIDDSLFTIISILGTKFPTFHQCNYPFFAAHGARVPASPPITALVSLFGSALELDPAVLEDGGAGVTLAQGARVG